MWTEGVSGKKKLRIQKHTCGRGLRRTIRLSLRSVLLGDKRNRGVDSGAVFERRTTTGSAPNSLLTCLHTTTFTLLNIFSPLQMISIRIWEIPLSWHAKCAVQLPSASQKHACLSSLFNDFCHQENKLFAEFRHSKCCLTILPPSLH